MGPSCSQVVHCHNRVHDKTQNLLLFSLKCHPIYRGILKDRSLYRLRGAYDILMAAKVVAGIVS